jgi:hypothetical protein
VHALELPARVTHPVTGQRLALVRGKLPLWPYAMVVLCFVASRLIYWKHFALEFDTSPVFSFIQYIDPWFLINDFARSILYLHHQAPLQNVLVGVALRLFEPVTAYQVLRAIYLLSGLIIVLGMLHGMLRLAVQRTIAAVASSMYAVSPSTVLYENWLFYHLPVTLCLVLSLVALIRYYRRATLPAGLAFFGVVAAAALFRSTLGPVSFAAILLLLLLRPPIMPGRIGSARKRVLWAAAAPFCILVANSCKPSLLIGYGYGEAMLWGNLVAKMLNQFSIEERHRLIAEGKVSPAAEIFCLTDLRNFGALRLPHPPTGVPLLDRERAPNGRWNAHALEYLLITRKYYQPDAIYFLTHYPGEYWRRIRQALSEYCSATTRDSMLKRTANHHKLRPWIGAINRLFRPNSAERLLGLVLGLPLIFSYGCLRATRALWVGGSQRATGTVLAYLIVAILYVTAVTVLVSCGDFSRYRFDIDPFYLVILGLLLSDLVRFLGVSAAYVSGLMLDDGGRHERLRHG